MVASDGKVSAVIMAHFARFCKPGHSMVWGVWTMQDSVFLDNRTFQRVWQRVAGSTGAPAAAPPEADTLTDLLAECIRAKAAGAAFYAALSQRIRTGRQQLLCIAAQERAHQKELQVEYFLRTGKRCVPPAACPRLGTAVQDLRSVYTQELALAQRLDAAADTAPSPLREALSAMAQQDRCHAQTVRNLLACLLG